MTRALGWRKDPLDERDFNAARILMCVREKRASASLTAFRGPRLLQGQAGSCAAQAITRAVHLCERSNGVLDAPLTSAMYTYWVGRKQEYAGKFTKAPALEDSGMYPRLALKAVRNMGLVSADLCPYDWTKVNEELDEELTREAFDQQGLSYARILQTGLGRSSQVAGCLARNHPVIFGMQVDEAFGEVNSSQPIDSIDENRILGGHMLCVLEVLPNGDIVFDNWWDDWGFTDEHGNEGLGVMSAKLFGSSWIDDVYAINSTPLVRSA